MFRQAANRASSGQSKGTWTSAFGRTSRRKRFGSRTLSFEPLEARQMMSVVSALETLDERPLDAEGAVAAPLDTPAVVSQGNVNSDAPASVPRLTPSQSDASGAQSSQYLQLGSSGVGAFKGSVDFVGDRDRFRINAPRSGRMQIDLQATSGKLDPYLYVYDSQGDRIANNNDGGPGRDASVAVNVTAGHTYYVQAKAYNDKTIGDYRLRFDTSRDVALDSSGIGIATGSVGFVGDRDWVRIVAPKSGRMQIDLQATSGRLDPYLYVHNSSGARIAYNGNGGPGRDASLALNVTAGHTYYVQAKAYNDETTGDYRLRFDTSYDLGLDSSGDGSLKGSVGFVGDRDWVRIVAPRSGRIQIDLQATSGKLDPYLYVHNSHGDRIAYNNNGGLGSDARVTFDATAGHTYFVQAKAFNDKTTGSYRLECNSVVNYAILFSGGCDPDNNHKRYYDTIKSLYQTIVDKGWVSHEHVYVLHADGTSSAVDRSDGKDSDMSFAKGSKVLSATAKNLQDTLNWMAKTVDSNDHFLFFSCDHGGGKINSPMTGEELLCAWGEDIRDDQLATWLNGINAGHATYVFSQCYAGGMLDDLSLGENEFGSAATNHYELGYGMQFGREFVNALKAGHLNTFSAFDYAKEHTRTADRGWYPLNGGAYEDKVTHPWATGDSFSIFDAPSSRSWGRPQMDDGMGKDELETPEIPSNSWHNSENPCDVNGDGHVSPTDVLMVINYVNSHGGDSLLPTESASSRQFYDVNGDHLCTALDALMVINQINSKTAGAGESDAVVAAEIKSSANLGFLHLRPVNGQRPRTSWIAANSVAANRGSTDLTSIATGIQPTDSENAYAATDLVASRPNQLDQLTDLDATLSEFAAVLADITDDIDRLWCGMV